MRHRTLFLSILAVAVVAPAVAAPAASAPKGKYKGTATFPKGASYGAGTTIKSAKIGFQIKTESCPSDDGKTYKKTSCILWQPNVSMPLKCRSWTGNDPTPKPTASQKSMPYKVRISSTGKINTTIKVDQPSAAYKDTLRITGSVKGKKGSGKATFESRSDSAAIGGDCKGSFTFKVKRS